MKKFITALMLAATLGFGAESHAESVAGKILLWPANRIMDAMDVFSISVGVGNTVRIELMATEAVKVGGGIGTVFSLVKDYNRQYGVAMTNGWYWSLITAQQGNLERVGLCGTVKSYQEEIRGYIDPATDPTYDFYEGERDYWRIGGALGLIVEGELYLHPVEIADFVAGIFFIDLRADDYSMDSFE